MKTPDNPLRRYGISDDRWDHIFIIVQILGAIGCVMFTVGMFLVEDKQYINDIGTFLCMLAFLPMVTSNKSENEEEYDKIFRIGMTVFLLLGVIGIPVIYFLKLGFF